MRIRLSHVPYIAHKIAIDLLGSGFVTLTSGLEPVSKEADEILRDDLMKERAIEERANEIIDARIDEMDSMQVDKKNMFWLIKKR